VAGCASYTTMELGRFLASLHPMLVHFPIVLLLLGVLCDWIFLCGKRDARFGWAGLWLTLAGTASALVAFVCGILAETFASRAGIPHDPMEAHERYATGATWLFIALASVRLFLGNTPKPKLILAYLFVALAGCGLLVVTAYLGGRVVYEYGANVAGAVPLHGPSDEDLAAIAQHQEQRTLTYSNQMHHIFGWLVLGLTISVFCERLRLGPLAKLRLLMPWMFIGGGIYLFIFSDWDSWPLSDLRPITDIEVMLHKVIAGMMFAGGVAALVLRGRPSEASHVRERWIWQNKLIAVMALIGGGALFTHVHTNAPATSNAIGVYLHHTVMGIAALGVAVAVVLEDIRPKSRFVALLLPTLLLVQSILLLKYNEDLPWFLGYHEIDATPPKGGVLAQVPGGRAELVFDGETGALDLFFWEPKQAAPVAVAARSLPAVVEIGNALHEIEFTPRDANAGQTARFHTQAEWLRRVPLFTVRLHLDGKTAEFDPIVTAPVLPPLVGAEKVYGCPMCPDVLSAKPARCPMCRMELVEVPRSRMNERPRFDPDLRYRMELQTQPAPSAGQAAQLTFALHDQTSGTVVRDFRLVHEKLLHLLIASKDLSWFAHEHPELQPDGRFTLAQEFPFGGEFLLFADVTPEGSRMQVFRLPLRVEGEQRAPRPLQVNASLARQFDGYLVTFRTTPNPPQAGDHAQLSFTVMKDGKPVDDLELFLGAIGHCIVIHEDTETFLHSHPVQLTAAPPPPGGPRVTFHAHLPKRGLYKAWGQFNHGGKIITADFVFWAR